MHQDFGQAVVLAKIDFQAVVFGVNPRDHFAVAGIIWIVGAALSNALPELGDFGLGHIKQSRHHRHFDQFEKHVEVDHHDADEGPVAARHMSIIDRLKCDGQRRLDFTGLVLPFLVEHHASHGLDLDRTAPLDALFCKESIWGARHADCAIDENLSARDLIWLDFPVWPNAAAQLEGCHFEQVAPFKRRQINAVLCLLDLAELFRILAGLALVIPPENNGLYK